MNRPRAACMVLLAAASLGAGVIEPPGAGPADKIIEPAPRHGISFRLSAVNATATLSFPQNDENPAHLEKSINISGVLNSPDAKTPFFAPFIVVTELTDSRGTDLLTGAVRQTGARELPRREVAMQLKQAVLNQRIPADRVQGQLRGIKSLPDRIGVLRGHVDAFVASGVLRAKVKPERMEEAIEPAPGVRFLLSEWKPGKDATTVGFELHVRRDGDDPLLDPLFAGVRLLDEEGRVLQGMERTEEVTTRDEYICVLNDWKLPPALAEKTAHLELVVITRVEVVRFEFQASGLLLGGVE
jgi:hypothetical protein